MAINRNLINRKHNLREIFNARYHATVYDNAEWEMTASQTNYDVSTNQSSAFNNVKTAHYCSIRVGSDSITVKLLLYLIGALNLLASARFHSAINPLAPRADLNNFADQLERAIEKNFGGNKNKDTKLHELREGSFFPMDMATGIKEFGNISQE